MFLEPLMASSSDRKPEAWLHCFGVGEGWPGTDRRHASFLYQIGSTRLIVDCGDGLSAGYLAAGLDGEAVDHVLISHMHSDHVGGFSLFIQGLWLARRRKTLHVHAPAGAIPALQAWLHATLLPTALIGFLIEWHPLVASRPFACGGCTVTAFPTTHLDGLRRRLAASFPQTCFDAFSFLIESEGLRLGHSADIGQVRDLQPLLAGRLDLLVCELSHVSPADILRRLKSCDIRKMVWIHLSRRRWEARMATRRQISAVLGSARSRIARDGDRIRVA
jgi:ribonuclease Z